MLRCNPFLDLPSIKSVTGTSLTVQWLRLRASTAGGESSIPGRGTKIPHAEKHGPKIFFKK